MSFSPGGSGSSSVSTSQDVALSNPTSNEVLTYDGAVAKWKNLVVDLSSRAQTTGGGVEAVVTASIGSTYTVNLTSGNLFNLTLTANTNLSFSGATNSKACSITLMLKQDGTGGRTITWPGDVKWPGGVTPTLTAAAGKIDFVSMLTVDGGTTWYGFVSGLNY